MILVELILLLMLCAVGLGWLARRLRLPAPIALVVGGTLLGCVPRLPQFPFDPQLILVIVLPPILYQAALLTSWTDFKAHIRPISLLAIGLVVATTLAIGATLKWLVPDIPWAAAFVFGAIVSPPDAVAATAILSRLNIPRRMVTILEGESLLNDASGLVIYKLAIAAVATGYFSLAEASLDFALVSAGGVAIGVALAFVFIAIHRRLGDPFIEVMTSLCIPYTLYIVAEHLHVSGVLAVVAAGLVRGRYSPTIVSAPMRIMARSVWNVLVFILNSLIFILIGIQMSDLLDRLGHFSLPTLLAMGGLIFVVATLVRFAWIYPAAFLSRLLGGQGRPNAAASDSRELAIISWCGMRGIVSLAAALALPMTLPDGTAFPYRDLLIFLTFFVIAATLIIQGLTLAPLILRLKVGQDWEMADEQHKVRSAMGRAAITAMETHLSSAPAPEALVSALRREIHDGIAHVHVEGLPLTEKERMAATLRRVAIRAERAELIRLWRDNQISDEVMRHQEEILDYQEAQL